MNDPAEVFPVGHYLSEELIERGRDVAWLVKTCPCLSERRAEEILSGRSRPLRLKEAEELASVLGVSPALLVNLDRSWQIRHGELREDTDAGI